MMMRHVFKLELRRALTPLAGAIAVAIASQLFLAVLPPREYPVLAFLSPSGAVAIAILASAAGWWVVAALERRHSLATEFLLSRPTSRIGLLAARASTAFALGATILATVVVAQLAIGPGTLGVTLHRTGAATAVGAPSAKVAHSSADGPVRDPTPAGKQASPGGRPVEPDANAVQPLSVLLTILLLSWLVGTLAGLGSAVKSGRNIGWLRPGVLLAAGWAGAIAFLVWGPAVQSIALVAHPWLAPALLGTGLLLMAAVVAWRWRTGDLVSEPARDGDA